MNPFQHIARDLATKPARTWTDSSADAEPQITRVERIRRLLKSTGAAMTDAEIAWEMADHFPNFNTNLVWLLLKNDIAKGRVRMIRHGLYRWNHEFDSAEQTAIRAAIKLLTACGYQVSKP